MCSLPSTINAGTDAVGMEVLPSFRGEPFVARSPGCSIPLLHGSAASPCNTLIGHFIGAGCGWLSIAAFGLLDAGPADGPSVTWQYASAAMASERLLDQLP